MGKQWLWRIEHLSVGIPVEMNDQIPAAVDVAYDSFGPGTKSL